MSHVAFKFMCLFVAVLPCVSAGKWVGEDPLRSSLRGLSFSFRVLCVCGISVVRHFGGFVRPQAPGERLPFGGEPAGSYDRKTQSPEVWCCLC